MLGIPPLPKKISIKKPPGNERFFMCIHINF